MFKPVTTQPDFPSVERELLQKWYSQGVVKKCLHRNDNSSKHFSFMDGPITANNPMGVHHAWGRTYKDLWQRFFNMQGYKERFQNGFDCQGLWVEVEVEKELGIHNKKDIENLVPGDKIASITKFVELCKERVLRFSSIQTEQSKRLGYFMNWDNSYYTMSPQNNYMIWYFLKECFRKGWIYKGADSVPWCPRCQTAISQHEMLTEDYKEVVHESIYMQFPIVNHPNEYLLVWTTTPWTIPGNIAVAVDVDIEYYLVEAKNGDKLWIAKHRVDAVFTEGYNSVVKKEKGIELVGLKYRSAFDDLSGVVEVASKHPDIFHKVVPTDPLIMPISTTEGTGLVHTAVSAGVEDFKLGMKLGLPMISLIEDDATYLPSLGFETGKSGKKHPELVFDYMKSKETDDSHFVFMTHHYKHRYPACWRCKTELVWKVTQEWYIAMDRTERSEGDRLQGEGKSNLLEAEDKRGGAEAKSKVQRAQGKTLREQMVEVAKKINWHPEFGLDRELDWLKNMHDWLISKKNRYWGLALPIYECKKCGNFEVIGSEEELKERAVEGWDKFEGHTPHKPYIDEVKIKCSECGEIVSRIDDVGNVWLDAGIVPFSTLTDPKTGKVSYMTDKKYWQEWFPINFITESFPGQFKNWFYSMIAVSTVLEKTNPFETVLGYASMLGEDGRMMHKSWGNSIEFNEGADKIGVDVMRWMFFAQDPEQNILFGYKKADEVRRKFHLMLWNIYNFFVTYANIDGFEGKGERMKGEENILDRWILSRLNNTLKLVTEELVRFKSEPAALSIESFVNDLSLWYVRRSRDRVGADVDNKTDKNSFYSTMYEVLVTLSKTLAPVMPFIPDEIYTNLTGEESVHLADWAEVNEKTIDVELEKEMQAAREIVEKALSQRKLAGIKVRQPLQELIIKNQQLRIRDEVLALIKDEVNIKSINITEGKGELEVELDNQISDVLKAEGEAREIVRQIQEERKKLGTSLTEKVVVTLPYWPKEHEDYIKRKALVQTLMQGDIFLVTRL